MRTWTNVCTIAMAAFAFAAGAAEVLETSLWQSLIDAAAARGGGRVVIPAGVHPVGQLDLRSNVELHLEKDAVLEGALGLENYRVVVLPYSEGTWSAVVSAIGVTNVAITGTGMINGRGERWSMTIPCPPGVCKEGLRPRGVFFGNCRNVRLEDFILRDAACWGIVFKCCDGVRATGVRIDSHAHRNNDGFDIEAKNVLIERCEVDAGDDAICLKSNDPGFVVENVVIRECVARSHCNGLKIGTASHGTIRNIRFENCRVESPRRDFPSRVPGFLGRPAYERDGYGDWPNGVCISAVCVECVDGGSVSDVTYDGVSFVGCIVPIFVRGGRRTGRTCGTPPSDRNVLRDITIRRVRGVAAGTQPSSITGVDACRPANVRLEDIVIACRTDPTDGRSVSEPGGEFDGLYPEATMFIDLRLPAYGLYVDRADGVRLKDVRFNLLAGERDVRPPVFFSAKTTESKLKEE